MCMSADALAKLSLPDGSSRGAGPNPSSAIGDIYRQGNCNDYPAGHIVILVKARRNTSIVRSDTLTGDGVMGTEFVANIDFKPYTTPHDSIDDTIRALCPARLEYYSALDVPAYGFIQTFGHAGIDEEHVEDVARRTVPQGCQLIGRAGVRTGPSEPKGRHGRRLCSDSLLQRNSGSPSDLFEQMVT